VPRRNRPTIKFFLDLTNCGGLHWFKLGYRPRHCNYAQAHRVVYVAVFLGVVLVVTLSRVLSAAAPMPPAGMNILEA